MAPLVTVIWEPQRAKTVTSALLGTLRADPRSRAEFFALAGVPR
jgi:GTP cyclohydrolase I